MLVNVTGDILGILPLNLQRDILCFNQKALYDQVRTAFSQYINLVLRQHRTFNSDHDYVSLF